MGSKWFQNGSDVRRQADGKPRPARHGRGDHPHLWSGANSANEREKGARSLAKRIRQLSKQGREVHVVGHSHGGNVANDAACMIGWSLKQRRPKLRQRDDRGHAVLQDACDDKRAVGRVGVRRDDVASSILVRCSGRERWWPSAPGQARPSTAARQQSIASTGAAGAAILRFRRKSVRALGERLEGNGPRCHRGTGDRPTRSASRSASS